MLLILVDIWEGGCKYNRVMEWIINIFSMLYLLTPLIAHLVAR
jgi:hypothetical protein